MMPSRSRVRFAGRCDCSTSRMISSFSDAGFCAIGPDGEQSQRPDALDLHHLHGLMHMARVAGAEPHGVGAVGLVGRHIHILDAQQRNGAFRGIQGRPPAAFQHGGTDDHIVIAGFDQQVAARLQPRADIGDGLADLGLGFHAKEKSCSKAGAVTVRGLLFLYSLCIAELYGEVTTNQFGCMKTQLCRHFECRLAMVRQTREQLLQASQAHRQCHEQLLSDHTPARHGGGKSRHHFRLSDG